MFASSLVSLVDFCRRFALSVVLVAFAASLGAGVYVARHIAVNTDINQLLSPDLDWRKREKIFDQAFPHKIDTLVVVLDAKTSGQADRAAAALAAKLQTLPQLFTDVTRPDALPIFQTHGLLYLSKAELAATLDKIAQAQPVVGVVKSDPSLRGFFGMIGLMIQGAQAGVVQAGQIAKPLAVLDSFLTRVLNGQAQPLDWEGSVQDGASSARALRRFIIAKPVLDYTSLQPGAAASDEVRAAAQDLGLTAENGVRVRLTGSVPLNDEEFASVAQGTGFATILSGLFVLGLLFLGLRSWRIVLPIMLTLVVGLIATTSFATVAVGSLNLISVAFAVMFIGIAVDFGIQFGVRYRDQRHKQDDSAAALRATASVIAAPLAMAAAATALGFLSFTPTAYRGVSELGLIAGAGMVIAFLLNVTLLPALMTLTKPDAEADSIGFQKLAPLNAYLATHRKKIIPVIGILTLLSLPFAAQVRFDFDPLNLKNSKSDSVATMLEVLQDPDSDAYAAQILLPSLPEADALAQRVSSLPEVDHTLTLSSFVPEDQTVKRRMIAETYALLAPSFALKPAAAPTEKENRNALRQTAAQLRPAVALVPEAKKLADTLERFASQASAAQLDIAQKNLIQPLQAYAKEIHQILQPQSPVRFADVQKDLARDWITPDGRALVEIFPKRGASGNPRDPKMLKEFVEAVRKIAPDIGGTPVSLLESGHTVLTAFLQAGAYGVASIALLSFLVLRRGRDVVLMIAPLLVALCLTLATIRLLGMSLTYANIIALPLLLSLGVSYAVYFVFYARSGNADFLQSSMARAVLFSAGTVGVAFFSLVFSAHPGTRGMGELLTLALVYSLLSAFLMLPVLLVPSKKDKGQRAFTDS